MEKNRGRKRERVKGWKKVGGRERCSRVTSLPPLSLFAIHDFLVVASRSDVALHLASSSFNEEFGLLLVSSLGRPHRFYAIRRRSRVLLHPRSRIFLTIHRTRSLLDIGIWMVKKGTRKEARGLCPPLKSKRSGDGILYTRHCNVN